MPHSVLTRGRKMVARLTALAMVASIMVVGALPASAAIDTSATCPSSTPSAGFVDIAAYSAAQQLAINCLADYEITQGTSATTYSPQMDVSRWQMALFLTRQAEVHGVTLGDGSDQGFTDIAAYPAATQVAINQLAQLGVTTGTTATTYSPADPVTRWQMALFLTRLLDGAGYTLGDGSSQGFTDIAAYPASTQVAINQIAQAGVSEGFTATTFGPGQNTSRVQMASFLTRTLAADGVTPAPGANQTFAVSPSDMVSLTVAANPDSTTTDDRQFTVTNPVAGATHTIALFPAANVTISANGVVTFADTNSDNDADGIGDVDAWITVVNGAAVAADTQVVTVMPSGGLITFTIDGDIAESVVAVVFADANTNSQLDLQTASPANANPKAPSEAFGVSGVTKWLPPEGTFGTTYFGDVIEVNLADNWFTLDTTGDGIANVLINYAQGDNFEYSSGDFSGIDINLVQFESWLSVGDYMDVDKYNPGSSAEVEIENDIPNAPTNVAATYRSTQGDVRVTWTKATNPDITNYVVQRAPVSAAGVVGAYSDVVTVGNVAMADVAAVVGTSAYRVMAINDGGDRSPSSNVSQVTVAGPAGPTITSAAVTTDAIIIGAIDTGDVWKIVFNKGLDALVDTSQIWVVDGDGDLIKVENEAGGVAAGNTAATMVLSQTNVANDTLTITLTADPTNINAPGDGIFTYPSTITATAGITAAGVAVDLVASTDLTVS